MSDSKSDGMTPEPVVVPIRRQSIVLRSGACDMRVGPGVADQLGQATKSVAGKPGHTLARRRGVLRHRSRGPVWSREP